MQIEKKYYTVDTIDKVNLLIEHINQSNTIAYDTETNSLNTIKLSYYISKYDKKNVNRL